MFIVCVFGICVFDIDIKRRHCRHCENSQKSYKLSNERLVNLHRRMRGDMMMEVFQDD